MKYEYSNELRHHGILKQKWGVRNGPPYPLSGGDYSRSEKKAIYKARRNKNSIYNKKHFDKVLRKGSKINTLSYDANRTKDTDMFYATHTKSDLNQYNALFNKKVPQELFDKNGNSIGTGYCYKYRISNELKNNIKVASEDSGSNVFKNLYERDRDFYNFVTDPDRMQKHFVDDKYKFKGYKESRSVLEKMKDPKYRPTEKDIDTIYRMFNYVIPSMGTNSREAQDVAKQRAKFFSELKKEGYGAVLDTNDAIYGAFHANDPIIVFDMDNICNYYAKRVSQSEKTLATLSFVGKKTLGIK